VSLGQLVAGDCLLYPEGIALTGGDVTTDTVARVLCPDEHWGQVYFQTRLEPGDDPGDDQIAAMADAECYSDEAVNAILPSKCDGSMAMLFYPSRTSWGQYDRSPTPGG